MVEISLRTKKRRDMSEVWLLIDLRELSLSQSVVMVDCGRGVFTLGM